ncbi:unnamed protein product, partial [Urochloa humidicola]
SLPPLSSPSFPSSHLSLPKRSCAGDLRAGTGGQRARAKYEATGSCGLRVAAGAASSWAPWSGRLGGGGGGLRKGGTGGVPA